MSSSTLFKVLLAALLLHWFWEPIRPVRDVTANALSTAAEAITR